MDNATKYNSASGGRPPPAKLIVGCGYLGQRVAARWVERGDHVFAATRRAGRFEELRRLGVEPIVCDVLDPATLLTLPRVDTLLYCVALDRQSGQSMREVYVDGLNNVLDQVPRPGRFIHISSTSVYGQTDGEEVDEDALTEPLEESGQIVLEAERVLRLRLPEAIILRFAGIYGTGRLLRRQAIEKGEPIVADPEKWLNLIHVEDGAGAVLAAEKRGKAGRIYNICDGQPVRRRDFYSQMAKLLGAPPPRLAPPEPGQPPPPHERANRRIGSCRMRHELQFEPRFPNCEAGLAASID